MSDLDDAAAALKQATDRLTRAAEASEDAHREQRREDAVLDEVRKAWLKSPGPNVEYLRDAEAHLNVAIDNANKADSATAEAMAEFARAQAEYLQQLARAILTTSASP